MDDRRKHCRVHISLAAVVSDTKGKVGDYLVQNLSEGGALLVHGPPQPCGTAVHVVFQGPELESLSLDAAVQRAELAPDGTWQVAVQFQGASRATQELLQRAVLRAIERRGEPAILVVHHSPPFLATAARDLVALGYQAFLAVTQLEVVRFLGEHAAIRGVLVDVAAHSHYGLEVLEAIQQRFPGIRRIALGKGAWGEEWARVLSSTTADAVLCVPWTADELATALGRGDERDGARNVLGHASRTT